MRHPPSSAGPAEPARRPLLSRAFVLATAAHLLLAVVFHLLMATLARYALIAYGADGGLAGFVASSMVLGSVAGRLASGLLLDRFGRRRVVLASVILHMAAVACYLLPLDVTALIVVRIVHGIAFGASSTALATIAIVSIPQGRRGEGTGYFWGTVTLATGIGASVGFFIVDLMGQVGVFELAALLSLICVGTAAAIEPRSPHVRPRRASESARPLAVLSAAALPISLSVSLVSIAYAGVVAFVHSYAAEHGVATAAGIFFTCYTVAVIASRFFAGRLQDVRGDAVVMYPALGLLVASLLVLSASPAALSLALAGSLLGLGYGTLLPAGQTMALRRAGKGNEGTATSTFLAVLDLAFGVGPVVLGSLIPLLDLSGVFASSAMLVVGSGLLFRLVARRA